MSDTKWTPGPWKWSDTVRENGHPKITGSGLYGLVAVVGNGEGDNTRKESDAHLIAAAPDMAAEIEETRSGLVDLLYSIESGDLDTSNAHEWIAKRMIVQRDLLSKARGES